MRGQKGITIVALIITIIVMVILAGVAIATAILDGGVLQQSKNAQTQYEAGEELEKVKLAAGEASLAGAGVITKNNLIEALDEIFGREKYSLNSLGGYFELTILDTGRKYNIYTNGRVEGPIIPDAPLGKAEVGRIAQTNSTIDGKKYTSANPIIPAGFTAVNLGGNWNSSSGPEVDKGLVIKDDKGNEFVWVPISTEIKARVLNSDASAEPDVATWVTPSATRDSASGTMFDAVASNLNMAGCTTDLTGDGKVDAYDFKKQLENEFNLMAESLNKYKGFYVGRFETSVDGSNPQSKRSQTSSGSGEFVETFESNWYELYALNKKYSTSSVQGSMMWGSQYDAMMTWMGEAANITISGRNTNRTCGTAIDDVINNVYDIYGNSQEYTMEVALSEDELKSCHISRGGGRNSYIKPTSKMWLTSLNENSKYGSRLALYIK